MKTRQMTLKTIGAVAVTLMATGGQASVADDHQPVWAGHFESAYSVGSTRDEQFTPSSNPGSRPQDALIWAGQFEQAYDSSYQGGVVTRPIAGKYLLWAGQFRQAYSPVREDVPEGTGLIEVAMDRN